MTTDNPNVAVLRELAAWLVRNCACGTAFTAEQRAKLLELDAAILALEAQGEAVGEAERMPGTTGFTMAVFKASEVPIGTNLSLHPAAHGEVTDEYHAACLEARMSGDLTDDVWAVIEDAATRLRVAALAARTGKGESHG